MRAVALERMPTCLSAGQAERLACRWQPNAFCGLALAPTFSARGPKGREKKCAFAQCRNYDAVGKENTVPRRSEKTAPFALVSHCVGRIGAGRHPCQPKQVCCPCRRCVAEVGDDCWNAFPPESRVNLPVESIAGESPDAFLAPGRSQLPAVRAVAGF